MLMSSATTEAVVRAVEAALRAGLIPARAEKGTTFDISGFVLLAVYAQDPRGGISLDPILQPYLERYDLPALAAAVVKNGEIIASGAVGTRRAGTNNPVTINDRFHIGSDTKAMTALIAAMLVEGGKIRWTSTVGEVFPELAATMDPAVRGVTLEQLLSHTSGIPSDTDADEQLIQQSFAQEKLNLDELRRRPPARKVTTLA